MAGGKKKRSLTLIILLIAMIIMIGACFFLIKYKDKQAKVESETATTEDNVIVSLDVDTIKSIYFYNQKGEMSLVKNEEGVWNNSKEDLFPVNQTYASSMKNAFSSITSSITITDTTDFASFGLEVPTIQVTATKED
jgi:uncharacterized membrane protein